LEAIDRMYLNAHVPSLQTGGGVVYVLKTQLGVRVPSTAMVAPMSEGSSRRSSASSSARGSTWSGSKRGNEKTTSPSSTSPPSARDAFPSLGLPQDCMART
jgi:hypothetical protein